MHTFGTDRFMCRSFCLLHRRRSYKIKTSRRRKQTFFRTQRPEQWTELLIQRQQAHMHDNTHIREHTFVTECNTKHIDSAGHVWVAADSASKFPHQENEADQFFNELHFGTARKMSAVDWCKGPAVPNRCLKHKTFKIKALVTCSLWVKSNNKTSAHW